jgi:hypothetical protein
VEDGKADCLFAERACADPNTRCLLSVFLVSRLELDDKRMLVIENCAMEEKAYEPLKNNNKELIYVQQ